MSNSTAPGPAPTRYTLPLGFTGVASWAIAGTIAILFVWGLPYHAGS